MAPRIDFDRQFGFQVVGIDEVGCGALAGPVLAGAAIFTADLPPEGLLRDSKKLTPKKRTEIAETLKNLRGFKWALASCSVEEIDSLNILKATNLAMSKAFEALYITPQIVLVDGTRVPSISSPIQNIIKGDDQSLAIAAAAILAKVTRDALMQELSSLYPQYGFDKNAGYGTAKHLEALREFGPSPVHRLSYAPVKLALKSA